MTALLLSSGIAAETLTYPTTRQVQQVDEYHGEKISDPYRWLEEDTAPETREWIEAQNKVTFGYLKQIPERAEIEQRLTKLWNYERFGIPTPRGGRYFFNRNSGLQNQSVLYVTESLSKEPRVLLDPNTLSEDGTVGLAGYEPSDNGELLAYGISRAGSDWQEWRVRDVTTGQDREDLIKWVKFSGASWAADGSGFYYSRYDEPAPGTALTGLNEFQKLYFHKIGTPQSEDVLVYERKDQPKWGLGGGVTDDGRYLAIHVSEGTAPQNRFFYKDLAAPDSKVIELLKDFDARYEFVGNHGTNFFFSTDLDAPRGRVIAIDITRPEREHWQEVIPQAEQTLDAVSLVARHFICHYLKDAHSLVRLYEQDGRGAEFSRELVLPGLGTARGFSGRRTDKETFFYYSSFNVPGTIYRLEPSSGATSVFRKPNVDFKPEEYETRQVFVASKDGTKVPMFITHRRGLKLDGNAPTLLYGYGGFQVSLTPGFSVTELVWMERGGVCATANLRGGGEYGEEWHPAGTKLQKQNVFDDFIACAEWL
ncbi:MAG: prolyl oligopeptidase family serine peptidase, partial [Chthoniobacteraceae bacterium]